MWYLGDGAVAAAHLVLAERVDVGLVATALTQLGTIGRTEKTFRVRVFAQNKICAAF